MKVVVCATTELTSRALESRARTRSTFTSDNGEAKRRETFAGKGEHVHPPRFPTRRGFCHGTTATGNLVLRTAAFVVLWLFAVWAVQPASCINRQQTHAPYSGQIDP